MTGAAPASGKRSRNERLAEQFKKEKFRKSYFARQLKVFLAAQIRALRGEKTQAEFGELIGKPQSVVARLEKESYGKVNLQTLIDIASRLDIALIIRFVNFPTFLEWTKDYSPSALAPQSYANAAAESHRRELVNSLHGEGLNRNAQPSRLIGDIEAEVTSQDVSDQSIRDRLHEGPQLFKHQKGQERVIERALQQCV
jgi:transcriptional regulator with XRE-family HTH domain